ncbi:FHA domain-containing protein [Paraburkholderia sp. RL17-337-BIB-A]|uniref:FHA domain-containing protein n=1 Tax=Paraburkholderia sp. RL17-337-BIB-A TaxID=3031636 RepID=UPI0038BBFE7D
MLQPSLKLTILASHGQALASGACASFVPQGGNIGRAADSTLRLPDDDTVAERHAVIRAQYGAWCLLNIGGPAALTVNGKPIAAGQEIRLQSGDIVNIGSYVLQATETLPPAWDFQISRPSGAIPQDPNLPRPDIADGKSARFATPPMEPLVFGRLDGQSASEPPSVELDGLLDTPVDPLALFGAPRQGWENPTEGHSSDLFADLAGGRAASGFEATPTDGLHGFALRDDAPEHGAPLRLRIANAQTPRPSDSTPAPIATAMAATHAAYGESAPATERAAQAAVPQYGEHSQVKAALRHGGLIRVSCANTPVSLNDAPQEQPQERQSGSRDATTSALLALSEAFLDGAGIHPDRHIEAGLTPEFMRALGAIARALREW